MNNKEAKRQFIWGLIIANWGSQILEECRIVSQQKKMSRVFSEKKGKVNAGLHKLFTKNLDWRVKLFYTYDQVIKPISMLQGKSTFSLGQKKSSSQHYSFVLATQQLFSSFNLEYSAKVQHRQQTWSSLCHISVIPDIVLFTVL